ncbi:hypothetical protein MMC30_007061 [Trapelia coarctata]|nr:hypothetical protein [Trapelia coarctata]
MSSSSEGHEPTSFGWTGTLELRTQPVRAGILTLEDSSDNALKPVARYLRSIELGCKHLQGYLLDLEKIPIPEIYNFSEFKHLVRAIKWHADFPFSEVTRMVEEVVLPNFRSNLSDEELETRKSKKKPQNVYEGHTKLAQAIPELYKVARNSIMELSGDIELVRFTAANVGGVDLSLELSKYPKKKATTSTPREAPMELFVQVLRRCHGKLDRMKDRNVLEWLADDENIRKLATCSFQEPEDNISDGRPRAIGIAMDYVNSDAASAPFKEYIRSHSVVRTTAPGWEHFGPLHYLTKKLRFERFRDSHERLGQAIEAHRKLKYEGKQQGSG